MQVDVKLHIMRTQLRTGPLLVQVSRDRLQLQSILRSAQRPHRAECLQARIARPELQDAPTHRRAHASQYHLNGEP